MPKLEIRIPMLAKSLASTQDNKFKEAPAMKKNESPPIIKWKPPSHKKRMKEAAQDGAVNSMRDWVAGRISTKQHKENMDRCKAGMMGKGY